MPVGRHNLEQPVPSARPAAAAQGSAEPALPGFPVCIPIPDISPWLAGNTGIAGFSSFDSGETGPHIALVSLIHGNELVGAIVLDRLLRAGFRPKTGRLTLGFANIAAFAAFDPENPTASRFLDEDMNRVWDDMQLFGIRRSRELDRAREIRPLIDAADILLDLHSMLWPSDPLLLCGVAPQSRRLAMSLGTPPLVVADQGHAGGKRLIDYGRFTETGGHAACALIEAGQHWQPETIEQMQATIAAVLHNARPDTQPAAAPAGSRFAEVTHVVTAKTNRFVFDRPYRGGEKIAEAGSLIAHDGEAEIRTPYEDCLLIMPSFRPGHGHTAVRFARLRN